MTDDEYETALKQIRIASETGKAICQSATAADAESKTLAYLLATQARRRAEQWALCDLPGQIAVAATQGSDYFTIGNVRDQHERAEVCRHLGLTVTEHVYDDRDVDTGINYSTTAYRVYF